MNYDRSLNDGKHFFVFGSNEAGNPAGGAAREAAAWWGAEMHIGFGPVGGSFAIPTMDWKMQALPLEVIRHYVDRFIAFARLKPKATFLVTAIGTGICGYTHEEIAPMFTTAPDNCVLPEEWGTILFTRSWPK